MLFIENYNAQSLDRSSVSMIDKFNGRLALVGELLSRLMALVDSLLATITDIRQALGVCKTRIYSNLDQVKEVVSGNGITGADSTIQAIEDSLKAGDKAIEKAEATLEGIKEQESCNQEIDPTKEIDNDCGEIAQQTGGFSEEDCSYCLYSSSLTDGDQPIMEDSTCPVCNHSGCILDMSCDQEHTSGMPSDSCAYNVTVDVSCNETTGVNVDCAEISCSFNTGTITDPGCTFSCTHSSECHEIPMPESCTYSCSDGSGCAYGGTDCSYSTTCGQNAQQEQETEECGQPCGETCHMTTEPEEHDCSEDCSEGSCGEDCGNCGQQGCDETGTEQGCAEGSCGEGSCGML